MRRFIFLIITLLLSFTACAQSEAEKWDRMRIVTEKMTEDYFKKDFVLGDYVFKHDFSDWYVCTVKDKDEAVALQEFCQDNKEKIEEKYEVSLMILPNINKSGDRGYQVNIIIMSKEKAEELNRKIQKEEEKQARLKSLSNFLEQ